MSQVVVAMVTRSVISSSEQFSAVQHVEMMTILFHCYNLLRLSPQCLHFTNTIALEILSEQFSGIMDICRVTFAKVSTTIPIKMNNRHVSIGMLYDTSPLTFCHISPNPMSVPKPF